LYINPTFSEIELFITILCPSQSKIRDCGLRFALDHESMREAESEFTREKRSVNRGGKIDVTLQACLFQHVTLNGKAADFRPLKTAA
jgi:hypothetical protein